MSTAMSIRSPTLSDMVCPQSAPCTSAPEGRPDVCDVALCRAMDRHLWTAISAGAMCGMATQATGAVNNYGIMSRLARATNCITP